MRREEGNRVVSPVVAQPALHEVVVLDELVHRHQLDRGHAEIVEMLHDRRVSDRRVGAAQLRRDLRVEHRHAADVGFVDDGLVQRCIGRTVVAPVEVGVADDRLGDVTSGVGVVARLRVVELVGEARRVPVDVAGDRLGVGVEQQLVRVAAQTVERLPGTVDPVPVRLPRAHVGEIGVPDVAVDLGQLDAHLVAIGTVERPGRAEQAQLDAVGDAREQREVRPGAVVARAQREGATDPDAGIGAYGRGRRRRNHARGHGAIVPRSGPVETPALSRGLRAGRVGGTVTGRCGAHVDGAAIRSNAPISTAVPLISASTRCTPG